MKKLFAAACAAAIVLVSCQEESFDGQHDSDNYYASVESFGSDTRTALGEGRTVVWSSEDRIAIFEGGNVGQAYQVLDSYIGKSTGEFTSVDGLTTGGAIAAIDGTIAIYPFEEGITVSSGKNEEYVIEGVDFPSEQKYVADSFSDEAFPMVSLSTSGSRNLSFKNIGGILKLSLTGSYAVSKITLTGNSGEPLSGSATVTLGSDGIPSVTMSEDASTSVSLLCSPAVQLDSDKATDFYISIPPTEFEGGFTVTVTDSEGANYSKSTEKQNNVHRSRILGMPILGSGDFSIMKLSENAKIYNEDLTRHFTSVTNGKIVVSNDMAEEDIPQVGKIIICPATENTPYGYIGKVVAAEPTASGFEIQTEVVPMNEAFEELHISSVIDIAPYIESVEDGDGNKLDFRMIPNSEYPQTFQQTRAQTNENLHFAVKIEGDEFEGEIYQNNRFTVDIEISRFKIKKFDISIEKKSGVKGEWELLGLETEDFKCTLGELEVNAAPIPIPGTPIVIVPVLYSELFFESKAEVSLTSELGLVLEHQLYKFSYNGGNPISTSTDLLTGPKAYFQFNSLEAKGEMALGLSGGMKMAFWNEALLSLGTELTVKGTVGIEGEISMDDQLLKSNVKAYLTPSITSTIYAESFMLEMSGFDDGKIKNDFATLELEGLEVYALPRFSNIKTNKEGLEITVVADVDKLSLIRCEEKGFALFEKDGKVALEHIAFNDAEPNPTTNRQTVMATLPSAEKEYTLKPYVLAFDNYYYIDEDDRWVDLGLSVLWAAYNVGANSPEEYGGYYAWGEISTKSDYTWENYKYGEVFFDEEYGEYGVGIFIGNEISGTSYDVAYVDWSGGARMPTLAELQELVNHCTFKSGLYNEVRGNYVTGPNGNSIFLPFTGYRAYGSREGEGIKGFYRSGTYKGVTNGVGSFYLYSHEGNIGISSPEGYTRYIGESVRPVKDK